MESSSGCLAIPDMVLRASREEGFPLASPTLRRFTMVVEVRRGVDG